LGGADIPKIGTVREWPEVDMYSSVSPWHPDDGRKGAKRSAKQIGDWTAVKTTTYNDAVIYEERLFT
jgi:hypothetical protein